MKLCRPSHPVASVLVLAAAGAAFSPALEAVPVVSVFVGAPPQKTLVERVGGGRVEVAALVGRGQDPHHFSVTPSQAVALGKADIYFATGLPFETGLVERLGGSRPDLPLVNLAAGIELMAGDGHDHGEDGDHEGHGDGEAGHDDHDHDDAHAAHAHGHAEDPHIWLSPPLLKQQAATVRDALTRLAPEHRDEFAANTEVLHRELDALHEEVRERLAPLEGASFFVYHPAFGYFAQAYGLEQRAVETGGNRPSAKRLVELVKEARAAGARALFVQPGFDTTSARTLARQIGCGVTELDPLAPDPVANIRKISETLAGSLTPAGGPASTR